MVRIKCFSVWTVDSLTSKRQNRQSLNNLFRLRVDKGERTAAFTGRGRELFEIAAREGIELPDVARGYPMMRGAGLGPERKAIVLAAAGRFYVEKNIARALRSTFQHSLASTT